MKPRFMIVMVTLFGPTILHAQDLESCTTIEEPSNRLACYDDVSGFTPAEVEEATTEETTRDSLWRFVESQDDFSGKNTSYVFLESDRAGQNFSDAPKSIVVRCSETGGHDIIVVSNGYIGSRGNVKVRYRFGENEPISESWQISTDGKAAFLPSGFKDFRTNLKTGLQFVFEITDFRGSRASAKFPLTETGRDFDFVLNGCR